MTIGVIMDSPEFKETMDGNHITTIMTEKSLIMVKGAESTMIMATAGFPGHQVSTII